LYSAFVFVFWFKLGSPGGQGVEPPVRKN